MPFLYRGVHTHRLHRYMDPPSIDPSTGLPLPVIVVNGERCVTVNDDGSMARGTAGANTPGTYGPGWAPSYWEQEL